MLMRLVILLAFSAFLVISDRAASGFVQCQALGCLPEELR